MWDPELPLDWSPGRVTTTTSLDPTQERKDALDKVIVYLEGEIKKLVAKMNNPTTEEDISKMAECWHITQHIDAISKMKELPNA